MLKHAIADADVQAIFDTYPENTREQLLNLRQMIYEVAQQTDGVGELEETLKWGQISYLTPATKSGTTIRIDAIRDQTQQIAIYVNCKTTLVDTYRSLYSDLLDFEGNRCVKFNMIDNLPEDAIKHCIELALTYHKSKKIIEAIK